MFTLSGYNIIEQVYADQTTQLQRALRLCDEQPVILRHLNRGHLSTKHLYRFTYAHELLKRFDHPNIVTVRDWIESDDGPVMILEDVGGIGLKRYLDKAANNQLPIEIFFKIAVQLVNVLGEIHQERLIFKNLHTRNILINPDDASVQVFDFDLASLLTHEQPSLKPPEQIEGELDYISPEQTGRMNCRLDYRSDFYSLGVIFYELLTGQLPFKGEDKLDTIHQHLAHHPTPVMNIRPDVTETLSQMIDKLLAKDAGSRYQYFLGLSFDLEKVFKNWQLGKSNAFTLGQKDFSGKLHLPQCLYGRGPEILALFTYFQRAVYGQPQIVAVVGASGMGKSALVNELHKPLVAHKGLFIRGKSERDAQNSPYAPLKQALRSWIKFALTLEPERLGFLQTKLQQTLANNARVLVDFIPELKTVFGLLPEAPRLTFIESQSRLNHLLCQLVQCISQMQPLVLFLDDLQWSDPGTLSWLQNLMQEAAGHFLIVVAYSDSEVSSEHPSIIALNQIDALETLSLSALSQTALEQFLIDTLKQRGQGVSELAALLRARTGGNPFFINEFLKLLYQNGMLDFDLHAQCWRWDLKQIEAIAISDNVFGLLTQQLQLLAPDSRRLLHISACLGHQFDLTRLAVAADISVAECARELWPVLQAGFILQESGDCFFEIASLIDLEGQDFDLDQGAEVPQCRFTHDNVLQAAYNDSQHYNRQQTHLEIGRRLLKYYAEEGSKRHQYLFGTLKHLNKSCTLVSEPDERLQLAQLNSQAAQKAKQAGAWEATSRYAELGLSLLPANCWQLHYDLAYLLSLISAECSVISGQHDQAEKLYREVLREACSKQEKAQVCLKQMTLLFSQGQWSAVLVIGEQGLNLCGLSVPNTEQALLMALDDTEKTLEKWIADKAISEISLLPEVHHSLKQTAMGLLANMGLCSFIIGKAHNTKLYIQQALVLSYEYGKSDLTALVLAIQAMLKARHEQYSEAVNYGEQALKIMASYSHCREASNILNILALCVMHYQLPLGQVRKLHQQGYQQGLAVGDTMRAVINLNSELFLGLSQGCLLADLGRDAAHCAKITSAHKIFQPTSLVMQRLAESLMSGKFELRDSDFNKTLIDNIEKSFHQASLDHARLLYAFWSNKTAEEKLVELLQADSTLGWSPESSVNIDHHLIAGITLIEVLLKQSDSPEHARYAELLQSSFKTIRKLAEFNPNNFAHKHKLLQAEKLRLEDAEPWEAMPYYQQAIDSAKEHGYLQYQALANELCGEFCLRRGNTLMASHYLAEAYGLYNEWGCKVRVDNLLKRHSNILQHLELQSRYEQNIRISEAIEQRPQTSILITKTHLAEELKSKQNLDLTTVIKASQAISSEVQVNKLIATVIQIIMENTGAQIGALVLVKDSGASIEAYQNALSGDSEFVHAYCLETSTNLPVIPIQAALSHQETILLADGTVGTPYQSDRYLQKHQTQSLLCFPLKHREQVIGILYLEHRTLPGVFTEARLKLIQLLLEQASISLENARLFTDAQDFNNELEQKVKARTVALQASNDKLHYLATRDPLTDMFNRRYFMDNGEVAFEAAQKNASSLAVMIMDIDHFKQVNDNYGHPAGDKVLIAVSQHCREKLRSCDVLGRLGGEEFGVLLPDTSLKDAFAWAQKLVESLRPVEVETDKGSIKITMSIGLRCLVFPSTATLSEAMQQADEALYVAKESGRDRACLYAEK